ncbi:MAG: polysaccharide biosynthesis protein, partial [Rhodobacteraceae bacterium]
FSLGVSAALSLALWVVLPAMPVVMLAIFALVYFAAICLLRAGLLILVQAIYQRDRARVRVLIYGAGTTGVQLVTALRQDDGIEPVALIDDNAALHGGQVAGLPVLSPLRLDSILRDRAIDRVLLAMPSMNQARLMQLAQRIEAKGVDVQAVPSFAQLIGTEPLLERLAPLPARSFLGRDSRGVALGAAGDSYAARCVLVSGAGGSIGAELSRQILSCGPRRLVLFELNELALYTVHQQLSDLARDAGVELVPVLGSVTDARQVARVLKDQGVDVILHAAAYKHVPMVQANPLPGLANNVLGTQTLAREAAAAGVERFLLISSDKAVRPTNIMGASKRMAELVVQDLATRHTGTIFAMVRFGNVLGSSGSVVPLFQEQVQRGGPVTVTDPRVTRFFMTIEEAVNLVLAAGSVSQGGEIFVLDMGPPVPILSLARQVIEGAGYRLRDAENPDGDIEIRFIGLRPGEKLREELSISGTLQESRHPKIHYAIEKRPSELEVAAMLRAVTRALATGSPRDVENLVARWVEGPEDHEVAPQAFASKG